MKKTTTLLLGSAAAMLFATSGAQAADPIFDIKEPREPVYRCDIVGFIELPGTDICFKVGGFARLAVRVNDSDWGGDTWSIRPNPHVNAHWGFKHFDETQVAVFTTGLTTITSETVLVGDPDGGFVIDELHYLAGHDQLTMLPTGRFNLDARTATEYGTVRGFMEFQSTGGALTMRHAFVQFGNWTFGQTWTPFHGPGLAPAHSMTAQLHDATFRTPLIQYTQPFGNGFSATLAVESPATRGSVKQFISTDDDGWPMDHRHRDIFRASDARTTSFWPLAWSGSHVDHAPRKIPNITGNIAASGAGWAAQLGGVLVFHDLHAPVGTSADGLDVVHMRDAGDKVGWGVNFGAEVGIVPDFTFYFHTTYTDGASEYNAGTSQSLVWGGLDCEITNDFLAEKGVSAFEHDVFPHCGIRDTVKVWTIGAAIGWAFSPTTTLNFGGAYGHIDFGSHTGVSGIYHPNDPEVDTIHAHALKQKAWELFANVQWRPASNTTFLLEGRWGRVDSGYNLTFEAGEEGDAGLRHFGGKNDAWAIGLDVVRSF